jgi:phage gp36-like protein
MMALHYTVLSPVEHDGKRYEVGQTIALLEDVAAALVAIGVIEQGAAPAADVRKPKASPGAADADPVR